MEWHWTATSDNLSLVDTINGNEDDGYQRIETHDWTQWDFLYDDIDDADHRNPLMSTFEDHGNPNPTLEPEWNVLHEIQWNFKTHLRGGTLVHTKGHQDDHLKYRDLPLMAQLNVDADRLAGQYQDDHGMARPTVLMFPHTLTLHLMSST